MFTGLMNHRTGFRTEFKDTIHLSIVFASVVNAVRRRTTPFLFGFMSENYFLPFLRLMIHTRLIKLYNVMYRYENIYKNDRFDPTQNT